MRSLFLPVDPTVVDLGCGTGLGLRLLGKAGIEPHYFGIDVAEKMLENFDVGESCPKSVELHHHDIELVDPEAFPVADLILSTFGSLSFVENRWSSIQTIAKIQPPGSKIMLMLLNRWSLRRLLRGSFSTTGRYKTRSTRGHMDVWAYFDSRDSACRSLRSAGYRIVHVSGGGPFAGVLELESLWPLNEKIGTRTTLMSHMITLVGERV